VLAVAATAFTVSAVAADENADDGFKPIFDGKSLDGWDGDPKFWRIEDGTITGQTTPENPTQGNTFLIWRGGEPGDFELKLQYRIVGGNSGIQYRSWEDPERKWVVGGYQADFEAGRNYNGILYEERGRGILAQRGQKTVVERDGDRHKVNVVGSVGDRDELQAKIKEEDWNDYHVIARGFELVHKINGHTMVEVTDNDEQARREKGIIAFQLHAGPPMLVQFRDVRLKKLDANVGQAFQPDAKTSQAFQPDNAATDARGSQRQAGKPDLRKIVFLAGRRSHGYGAHEHRAGCLLLANALNESGLPVRAEVHENGWPEDESVLDDADTIVIYSDGGGGHPFNAHIDKIDELMKRGVGLVAIHYGVEVPKGKSGDAFLDWTGGYFEAHWSVNPHWTANYEKLPDHPIARGVRPFKLNDEWYYHMRFRDEGVTPILTDLPPEDSLSRPDGSHSGNPHVRKAVLERKEPQHMAWARERPDGGRGFGVTGGHWHWNWGHNQFRKLVLNAIVWTAGLEVPEDGVPSRSLTVEDLEANQDFPQPEDFNRARIQALLEEWNRGDE
jgi:hypothetical protein